MRSGGNLVDGGRKLPVDFQSDVVKMNAWRWKERQGLIPIRNLPRELAFDEGGCFFVYQGKLNQLRQQEIKARREDEKRRKNE